MRNPFKKPVHILTLKENSHTKHVEGNPGDEEVEWIIFRSGSKPKVTNLDGWGS